MRGIFLLMSVTLSLWTQGVWAGGQAQNYQLQYSVVGNYRDNKGQVSGALLCSGKSAIRDLETITGKANSLPELIASCPDLRVGSSQALKLYFKEAFYVDDNKVAKKIFIVGFQSPRSAFSQTLRDLQLTPKKSELSFEFTDADPRNLSKAYTSYNLMLTIFER